VGRARGRAVADGSYGQGWNGVGATEYLGTTGATLRGVTGLFYGDHTQIVAQLFEGGAGLIWNVVVGGLMFWGLASWSKATA